MTLHSRVRAVEVAAEITDEVMPRVVCLPHGWGDDQRIDALSGTAVLNGTPFEVEPVTYQTISPLRLAGNGVIRSSFSQFPTSFANRPLSLPLPGGPKTIRSHQ